MQYTEEVRITIDYVIQRNFDVSIHWLNPGYSDVEGYFDNLGLTNVLLSNSASLSIRNGKLATKRRVAELRELIYGWARFRDLLVQCK